MEKEIACDRREPRKSLPTRCYPRYGLNCPTRAGVIPLNSCGESGDFPGVFTEPTFLDHWYDGCIKAVRWLILTPIGDAELILTAIDPREA